jgi:hypothetical protein
MSGPVRCALTAFLTFAGLVGASCVSSNPHETDAAVRPDGGSAAHPDAGGTPDAVAAAPISCREIRVCIYACGTDNGCAARCVSSAPTAARALYQQAQACSAGACDQGDIACRCEQECDATGSCYDIVNECDEAVSDPFCDGPCH